MGAGQSSGRAVPVLRSVPGMTQANSYSLILVRHGVSCANLKKALGQQFITYTDPELTRAGKVKAINRGKLLRDYLEESGLQNPIVGASVLIRAQQTAFLMMSPDYREGDYLENLYVVPYVSEVGSSWFYPREDNRPLKTAEKVAILKKTTPALLSHFRYVPADYPQDAATPSPDKFVQWLRTNYPMLNEQEPGEGQNRPIIIFTHGNYILQFIKYVMKIYPGRHADPISKKDRPNYTAFKFNVSLDARGNISTIGWDGILPYASEIDEDPEAPYSVTTQIDTSKECVGEGDLCRKRVCSGSSQHPFFTAERRNPLATRRNTNTRANNNANANTRIGGVLERRANTRRSRPIRANEAVLLGNNNNDNTNSVQYAIPVNNLRGRRAPPPVNRALAAGAPAASTGAEEVFENVQLDVPPADNTNTRSPFDGGRRRSRRHAKKSHVRFSRKVYRRRF
jgi:broad specificity phosphatase PhoE